MKKKAILLVELIAVLILIALLLYSYIAYRGESRYAVRPSNTRITIEHTGGLDFLQEEDVARLLPFALQDSSLVAVNPAKVESLLITNLTYAQEVNTYISPSTNTLNIHLKSRTPILRYLQGGRWYFLDSEGSPIVPRVGSSAYVPVAVGNITDETVSTLLLPLAQYLKSNKKWHHFFGLIEIVSPRKIHLHPRVGDYIFEITSVDNLDEDLSKISIFYQKIVKQVGANKYRLVKLSYKDQIVCKKR
ncbi:MAG: hypothetical protein Q4D93_03830 [Porphyromonas sp.]|nr:hypothetical protein [Porphyromonas sp.]